MRTCRTGDGLYVVSDNEVLVMFVTSDGIVTARNISHTVGKYLLKEEIFLFIIY
jgi:hypothetical protein